MEPTPADVAAVQASLSGQPAPAPVAPVEQVAPVQQAPAPQQQPAPPVAQPAPAQQANADPFAAFTQPTEPIAPATQPTQQPTEPMPTPQQPVTPVEPSQPTQAQPPQQTTQPVQPAPEPQQTYEEYINSVLTGVPQAPAQPDPSQVNPEDPESIKGFFDELMSTAEQRFEANYARKQAIQTSEKNLWEQAFDKYASLRTNTELRDMVHAIRMSEFSKGTAITPTQAAERLLGALGGQYQKGVVDNQVVTTYEQVQPNGGGTTTVPTTMDADQALLAVQTGGEAALAQVLDDRFKAQAQ